MDKIILLDWDGPISNSRTWKMPGCVDPVAIQLLNDLTMNGWRTVLTSTIRKHFRGRTDPEDCAEVGDESKALMEAQKFMRAAGFYVQFYPNWRTDPDYTSYRHREVANWMMNNPDIPDNAVFLVVDDEHFPHEMLRLRRMDQVHASSHAGIDYLSISEAYRIGLMTDEQLEQHFKPGGEE